MWCPVSTDNAPFRSSTIAFSASLGRLHGARQWASPWSERTFPAFAELPYLLTGEECKEILAAHNYTMTGATCWVSVTELYLHLLKWPVSKNILSYCTWTTQNTRNILRLYNYTWLHHELCNKVITKFHSGMSHNKLFGSYIHALVVHAPQQLEIIALRSVNTENQEQLFEQSRSATAASNRHSANVLSSTGLRLQAKDTFKYVVDANHIANSNVARAGKVVPKYKGTHVTMEFITNWQKFTLWRPEVHIRAIHFNVNTRFVWRLWGLMICTWGWK